MCCYLLEVTELMDESYWSVFLDRSITIIGLYWIRTDDVSSQVRQIYCKMFSKCYCTCSVLPILCLLTLLQDFAILILKV